MKWLFCCAMLAVMTDRCGTDAPHAVAVAEDGALSLTLATFNIRYENPAERDWRAWPNRIGRVVRSIRTIGPDVFGVQECLHGQAADLRASLPDYDFHGVGREDGKRGGEYAAVFFRRDRFEQTHGGHFWLSDFPDQAGSKTWGNGYPRMVSWVRLVDRASGRGFSVFNTHLDHRNQYSREKSAPLIGRRMAERPHAEEPVVLLGDFNATEGNPAVDYFTGKAVTLAGEKHAGREQPLLDPYQLLNPQVRNRRTLHFWEGHRTGWAKVDHILVSRGARIEAADIRVEPSREEQPSDHFPVWAKVSWP
jgi:endonuclease/exonuclease/phosphatase family metal-dependent hydrolase